MALVSTSIPNLLNGVSQQPSSIRQVTQGESQVNALSSVIDGLIKRPPTEHVAKIINSAVSNAAIHVVDRGVGFQHILVVQATSSSASISAFDLSGNAVTVNASGTNLQYLYCDDPANDLQFLTVADYTFVLNKTKTVAEDSTVVSGSLQGTNYQEFADLPTNASVGNLYQVIGSETNSFDTYYVKALSANTYEETVKPAETYKLDYSTMPYSIVPSSSGTFNFTLQQNTWGNRIVGDSTSAPFPSFVGKTLANMFFYKNRLGFITEENVVMSAAGDFLRFFPKTVTTLLDEAPIDVSVAHTKVSLLRHAIPFNESLTLFADTTQFTIENLGSLTPKTISIIPSTEFENDTSVAPVGAGNYLFFVSRKGDFSSVREYYVQSDTVITDALEVTAHVPKYVPKNITKLATSSNEDILVCLSSEDRGKLYIYKWFTDGAQKLQSSWSTWEFATGTSILDINILENELYLVISRSDGVFVEKVKLQYPNDTGLTFNIRADRKTTLTGSYNAGTNTTTWTLPYVYDGTMVVAKSGSWSNRKGVDITTTRPTTSTIAATGDYSAASVIVGVPYTMTYQFSTQHVREKEGTQSVQSGRLQLRTMRVNYEDTGFFKVQVTPEARTTNEYEFTGVVLNQASSTIEDVILSDGTFRFPVQSKNDRVNISVTSDSYLPCAFQNAEWEGFYHIRSRRI
tara:strand:- start:1394 stop:3451 length:2058 start_codon:yes stop_codon:yes gene_type:complete